MQIFSCRWHPRVLCAPTTLALAAATAALALAASALALPAPALAGAALPAATAAVALAASSIRAAAGTAAASATTAARALATRVRAGRAALAGRGMTSGALLRGLCLGTSALGLACVDAGRLFANQLAHISVGRLRGARGDLNLGGAHNLAHFTALLGQYEGDDVALVAGASGAARAV